MVEHDRFTLHAFEQYTRVEMVSTMIHHGTALEVVARFTRSSTTVARYRGGVPRS